MIGRRSARQSIGFFIVLALLVAPAAYAGPAEVLKAPATSNPILPSAVPGLHVVKMRSGETTSSVGKKLGVNTTSIKAGWNNTAEIRTPPGKTDRQFQEELEATGAFEYASPVYYRSLAYDANPDDPSFNDTTSWTDGMGTYPWGKGWWLHPYGVYAYPLWNAATNDATWYARADPSTVPVAVIDTGCYLAHPDLQNNVVGKRDEFATYVESEGVLTTDSDVTPVDCTHSINGESEVSHGTFIAGQIGATTNNALGLASVGYDLPVWVYKVQGLYYNDEYPEGVAVIMDTAVINAIYHATDDGAKVINLSLGGPEYSQALQEAVDYAYAHGVLVVAAVGNSGTRDGAWYPAANNHVIGVGAYGLSGSSTTRIRAPFSNSGLGADPAGAGENNGALDILAPGCTMWGAVKPDWDEDGSGEVAVPGYTFRQGTSMASAAFAGCAAYLWRFGPDLSPDQLAQLFLTSALPTGDAADGAGIMGWSAAYTALRRVVPDLHPPSKPYSFQATASGKTTALLSWSYAADVSGIAKYTAYFSDGTWAGETTANSITITGLQPGTTYGFYATATDTVGNEGPPTAVLTVTTYPEVDNAPPPAPSGLWAAFIKTNAMNVYWGAVTDESGIAKYSLHFADGTLIGEDARAYRVLEVVDLAPSTTYSFYVTATDTAGNTSAPSELLVARTLDAPDTTPPEPPTGLTATHVSADSISLSWSPSTDPSGIARYQVFTAEKGYAGDTAACSFAITGLAPDTTYTCFVKVYDTKGNISTGSETISVTTAADTSPPPAPSLTASANGPNSVLLWWSATPDPSGISTYTVYLGTAPPQKVVSVGPVIAYELKGLAPSTTYYVTVTATDRRGNESGYSNVVPVRTQNSPVYRFYRPSTGTHFYTIDPAEMARVRDTMSSSYTFEGIAYTINMSNPANSVPLYRFYNRRTGTHLYTADEREKEYIRTNLSATYSLDGVAYYVSSTSGTEVHRFYDPKKGVHFYSCDPGEVSTVRVTLFRTWRYEGPAFYVGQ